MESHSKVDYIANLRDNLSSLGNASNQHQSWFLDLKTEAEGANEDLEQEVLNEAEDWMGKVEALQIQVWVILQQGNQETQVKFFEGDYPKNCRAKYKVQKVLIQRLIEVWDLIDKGHFEVVCQKFACVLLDELPLDKCHDCEKDKVDILYGMGGMGKIENKYGGNIATMHDVIRDMSF